jgi:UDPglucose 6-dehydrogenase
MKRQKITIVGSGYVGMSLGILLSQKHDVIILDIDESKVKKINSGSPTIKDQFIEKFLSENKMTIHATTDINEAYRNSKFIIIATPTNLDESSGNFDVDSVQKVIKDINEINKDAFIVIKSTIPIGFTESLKEEYPDQSIVFSPEFLREGNSLYDNLHPSRIIIGGNCKNSKLFSKILEDGAHKENINILFMSSTEAESVKLFSNSYLAMRVSFFNELDSFSYINGLSTENIISGISSDARIADGYNNPSFGYGGYCLPKDTRQLLFNFNQSQVPNAIINGIVEANKIRKDFITDCILNLNPKVVGFYRLIMKKGSDNFRSSAILSLIKRLKKKGIPIVIYEKQINHNEFLDLEVIPNLEEFKERSSLIVANRMSSSLEDVQDKVFTRDIFNEN